MTILYHYLFFDKLQSPTLHVLSVTRVGNSTVCRNPRGQSDEGPSACNIENKLLWVVTENEARKKDLHMEATP